MSAYKSDFLNVLAERGFIHQVSEPDALDQLAKSQPITAYIGFDCTAASLHIGSLLPIMMLHWMQQTGHRPIALMGGGTTRVGDPSGKDESRRILTDEMINQNLVGIRAIFAKFLKFEGQDFDGKAGNAIMANNADWLNTLNYIDFLRDVGRHFSVNRMLSFNSVKMRLDRQQELSFLEFNYMILQAYDFVELNRRTGCVLQMGGSDQWGNIVNGIDLGRRMERAAIRATAPLITTSSGAKMGKTAPGAVWLNPTWCPYEYWQYWRNTEDGDVRASSLFTGLPLDEIARLAALGARKSTKRRRCWPTRRRPCCMAVQPPKRPPAPHARPSRKARMTEPADRGDRQRRDAGSRRPDGVRQGRPRHLERRGTPPDQGRRPRGQRRDRHRREDGADACGAHARRRDQAVARQEGVRPDQAAIGRGSGKRNSGERPGR